MAAEQARSSGVVGVLIAIAFGTGIAVGIAALAAPGRLPDLSIHIYWYVGRSAGFVAYWLLFISVVMGLAISSRVFDGVVKRPWVFEVHKFISLFIVSVAVFHAFIFLPDPYAGFSAKDLLVPMQSGYRPEAVAVGIITLYGAILISASFYMKALIGQKGWRMLHYTTFALFVGALVHGLLSGTDSERSVVQISYLVSGVLLLFFTFFRILVTRAAGGKPRVERAEPAPAAGAR